MSEEYIWWLSAGLAAVIVFRAGMSFEREQVKERQKQQRQHERDLAELARFAGQFAIGDLTVEEADAKINSSFYCGPSARRLWAGFSIDEKRELGVNAVKLHANPEYVANQNKRMDDLKAAAPDLFAAAKKSTRGSKAS